MTSLKLAIATALMATAGAATAQTASDAQCIIVSNAFASQAKDAKAQEMAEAAVYFYLGRIGNQMTMPQFKALLEAQSKTLTDANAGATMQKCVTAIQAKVDLLQSVAPPAKPDPAKAPTPGR